MIQTSDLCKVTWNDSPLIVMCSTSNTRVISPHRHECIIMFSIILWRDELFWRTDFTETVNNFPIMFRFNFEESVQLQNQAINMNFMCFPLRCNLNIWTRFLFGLIPLPHQIYGQIGLQKRLCHTDNYTLVLCDRRAILSLTIAVFILEKICTLINVYLYRLKMG